MLLNRYIFFDNNGFIKNRVLQCFIKATTSKSRQNKTCIIHRIRKRKTTAFQPSSKFIVFKKLLSATVFCLLPTAIELSCIDFTDYHISNFL